jgi:hypothetical protein
VKTKGVTLTVSKVFDKTGSPSVGRGQCMYLVNNWTKALLRKIHTSDGFFRLAMRRSLKTCVALLWGSNIISPKVQIDALTFACTFSRKKRISWVSMSARDDKNATTTLGETKASQTDNAVSPAVS